MASNQNRFMVSSKLAAEQSNDKPVAGRAAAEHSNRLALILSMLFHLSVAVVIGWLVATNLPDGAGDVEARTGGIVLVDARREVTEYLSEGDVKPEKMPQEQQAAAASSQAASERAPELPGIAANDSDDGLAESVAKTLPDVGQMNLTESGSEKFGGRVTTQVFGVSGTGSKFVYVFDRSDSMSGFEQRPIKAARQELLKSLEALNESNQFQIIFYNKAIEVFAPDGYPRLYFADSDNLKDAKRFVKSIRPDGGTDHMKALEWAFRFSPEVIFLLTDAEVPGGFSNSQLARIAGLNRSKAIINVVEFGSFRGGDRSLEKVSRASGGQYVFKNVNSLKLNK